MSVIAVLLAVSAFQPKIPRAWETAAVAALEVPLANAKYSPNHIAEQDYYRIATRVIYRTYPVYHPSRQPAGYLEWLKQQEPQIAFDTAKLKTKADWIAAGELVFNAPTAHGPVFFGAADLADPKFYEKTGMPVAKDGTVPFARWVIRRKGEPELGSMGCNTCHTRVLPDGSVIPGAQGNSSGDQAGSWMLRKAVKAADPEAVLGRIRGFARQFEMPWLAQDPNRRAQTLPLDSFIAAGDEVPPGVTARSNTSMFVPPQIPDLIGVEERRHLDHTGSVRHNSIGDLMRYASLAQDMFAFDRYGEQQPVRAPGPNQVRYSDEQLYALALYVYSLRPPTNPNAFDATAARGKKVFESQGCQRCHTPPFYTNNKLIPVDGFQPSAAADVLATPLGTDPRYTLETHKGTGYYKVPSLKGVWYRGPFEHNGSVATLEDWFDAARLQPNYVPTGYKGFDGRTRGVPGHRFGLDLPAEDKRALIAFLKTL